MPDASHPFPPRDAPRAWSDAFNALPLEAPPADAWPALAGRLEARRRTRRLPAWLGLAAAAAVVAAIAWPRLPTPAPAPVPVEPTHGRLPATTAQPVPATEVATTPAVGATEVATTPAAATTPIGKTLVAAATQVATTPTAVGPGPARLDTLQQESARLEALLAVARDERMASASAMLLADAFDAQVAGIDAALIEPGIGSGEREALWQARVDALQQAAGFVGTQRLLAAEGHADALLVSVD